MSVETKTALGVLAAAFALGALADALFQDQALGLNVPLWIAALVVALALLLRVSRAPRHQGRRFMILPLLVFGGFFAWHDSPLLVAANLLALAAAVALGALRRPSPEMRTTGVLDLVGGFVALGCGTAGGPIPLLEEDVRWSEVWSAASRGRIVGVARGIAIALPFVVLFGALFVAADAVFKGYVTDAVPSLDQPVVRIGLTFAGSWLSMGLLRDLLAAREERRTVSAATIADAKPPFRLGFTEAAVVLALLDLLFLAFVVVQFRYLFGGKGLVETRTHLTYAQYARHGFFELVAVTALALPLLLLGDWLVRRERRRDELVFRGLAGGLVALLFVVMLSALQRMRLYEREYGLTELRIYATGLILWLAAVSAWFAMTVLRGERRRFAAGALAAGFVATIALNVLNPDALIVRTNLSRPHVDTAYLAGLSDDGVPALVERLPSLRPELRRDLAERLAARKLPPTGWRSWSASRAAARTALVAHRRAFGRIASP